MIANCVLLVDLAMNPCKLDAKSHLAHFKNWAYKSKLQTAYDIIFVRPDKERERA